METAHQVPAANYDEASRLLGLLFCDDDLIELRPIECWNEAGHKKSLPLGRQWSRVQDVSGHFDWLQDLNQTRFGNAFFGVCPRKGRGGKKQDVACVRALWADIDHCEPREAIFRVDEAGLPRPSIIVNSGTGVHLYWLLKTPFQLCGSAEIAHVENVIQRLARVLNADHTHDVSRLLRVPGFSNVKNARNGDQPTLCRIVSADDEPKIEDLDHFVEYLPGPSSTVEDEKKSTPARERNSHTQDLDDLVSEHLDIPSIADRSKADFRLLCEARRRGFEKEDVWRAVQLKSKFQVRGREYFELTWKKALKDVSAEERSDKRDRHLTDLGNAERLAYQHRDKVRYCHETSKWYVWSGKLWRPDDNGAVTQLATGTVRSIYGEAATQEVSEKSKSIAVWAMKSESRPRIDSMIALARSQPGIPVKTKELDADPWAFNVQNGTINLKTGSLEPHDPNNLITKLAPVAFDRSADCPQWRCFLDRIFNGDADLIRFVQRYLGYSMTACIQDQRLPIFYGPGANGKSVLLDTVTALMGDYATAAPPELLTVSRYKEHPTEIADLWGRRLVVASETEEGASLKIQLVKRLTGDARLKGRFMRMDYFEFERTHKLILVTNNRPRVREDSEAVWRRLYLIPFSVIIPPDERDPLLIDRLREEWSGIVNWLVEGCLDWQAHGLGDPEAVRSATEQYREDEDWLREFLEECCEESDELWVSRKCLYAKFLNWSDAVKIALKPDRAIFYERVRRIAGVSDAYGSEEGKRCRGFNGIGLRIDAGVCEPEYT